MKDSASATFSIATKH